GVRSDQLARPREQTTERTYPVCWYSVFKEQEGYFLTHPLVSSLKGKISTLFQKKFFDFFNFFCLTKKSSPILVRITTNQGRFF
ncbi:MAG: hypothetical protein II828_04495, partial [Clostridia bacterium]|nr:hypothetical protein [Clostridia bacterium]